ncbi:MAG: SLC13 family permease [Nitrospirota bacterium]
MKIIVKDSGEHIKRFLIIVSTLFLSSSLFFISPPAGLSSQGLRAIAIFIVCVIFWITNVIPLMITSILAVILFPLVGVMDAARSYSLFGNQAVFFILGAFILASSLMRSGLSIRIALLVLKRFGKTPERLLLGILLLSASMSFIMSEHAVAAMIFPILMEISDGLRLKNANSNYGKGLFLSMAWGCIIGGIATFLGGARAPLAVEILHKTTGKTIGFVEWSSAIIPTVIIMLVVLWVVLLRFFPSEIKDVTRARRVLEKKRLSLGRVTIKEKGIGLLMLATIFSWITYGEMLGLANIALAAVVIAFVFKLMKWKEVEEDVNWGIFLMYGGAICLGSGLEETGAALWLTQNSIGRFVESPIGLLFLLSFASTFFSEAISNTAVVALLMPIAIGLATEFSIDPKVITLILTVPAGLAFILPIGTPATALAFSSGFINVKDTIKAGLIIKIIAWAIFCLMALFYWPLLGIRL